MAATTSAHGAPASLCESCSNAVPQLCLFIRSKDAEKALTAMGGVEAVKYSSRRQQSAVYRVTACPKHVPGELPPITEKKYNLSCPYCGSVNSVKVAWTGALPPEEWYCRCTKCKKSFRPKKKEVDKTMDTVNENAESCNNSADLFNTEPGGVQDQEPANEKLPDFRKTRKQIILEKLDKDGYLKLKEKGLSDEAVLEEIGINISWKDALVSLKRKWGLVGQFNKYDLRKSKPDPEKNPAADDGATADNVKIEHHQELNINDAIKRRDFLAEEVECADRLLNPDGDYYASVTLTHGIKLLLDGHRCICAQELKRIRDVFETVKVAI